MGVKHSEKCRGKVDSALIGEHIGILKQKCITDDPYRAGEQSRKRAKLNAVLAAANTRAHAAKEKAAECPLLASLPACLPLSPAPYPQMHMPAIYPLVHIPTPPP